MIQETIQQMLDIIQISDEDSSNDIKFKFQLYQTIKLLRLKYYGE